MARFKYVFFLLMGAPVQSVFSQSVEIQGKVESKLDVENINVINKTAQVYATTNAKGEFTIKVKLNDTLVFSSIQYEPKQVIINQNMILSRMIKVYLDEKINLLDAVTVGKVLTGNLLSDIKNVEGKPPINFYDVGIPGYTGKIATQSERRLSEAGVFKPQMLMGILGGGIPLNPILNGITGRTKMLKERVALEEKEALLHDVKSRLSKDFLMSNPLENDLVDDFFYFCADDDRFITYCKNQTDFKILIFLRMKYKQYLENLNSNKD